MSRNIIYTPGFTPCATATATAAAAATATANKRRRLIMKFHF
jgi:hypothetical protein